LILLGVSNEINLENAKRIEIRDRFRRTKKM
jgi:hypothetical protein